MPRLNNRVPEKVKDLKGTLIRVFKSLDQWRIPLVIATFFAMIAALLSTAKTWR